MPFFTGNFSQTLQQKSEIEMEKKKKKLCYLCPSHQSFLVCSQAIFYLLEQTLITTEQCFKIQSPSLAQVQKNKFNSHAGGALLYTTRVDSARLSSLQPFPSISIKYQYQHSWSIPVCYPAEFSQQFNYEFSRCLSSSGHREFLSSSALVRPNFQKWPQKWKGLSRDTVEEPLLGTFKTRDKTVVIIHQGALFLGR